MTITRERLREWIDIATIISFAVTALAQLSYDLGAISTSFPDAWRPYVVSIGGVLTTIGALTRTIIKMLSDITPNDPPPTPPAIPPTP